MPDPATLTSLGLIGLFLAALLAGSILPFPSEVVLLSLVAAGVHAPAAVATATAGNVLGAVTIYLLGRAIARGGARWLGPRARRWLVGDADEQHRSRERIRRYGALALLLSWVPIVGDVLVLGAALIGVRFSWFLCFVTLGKAGRYAAVAALTLSATG